MPSKAVMALEARSRSTMFASPARLYFLGEGLKCPLSPTTMNKVNRATRTDMRIRSPFSGDGVREGPVSCEIFESSDEDGDLAALSGTELLMACVSILRGERAREMSRFSNGRPSRAAAISPAPPWLGNRTATADQTRLIHRPKLATSACPIEGPGLARWPGWPRA